MRGLSALAWGEDALSMGRLTASDAGAMNDTFKLWEHRGLLEKGQRAIAKPRAHCQPSWLLHDRRLELHHVIRIRAESLRGVCLLQSRFAPAYGKGALATAEVSPINGRTAALSPSVLGYIGRYLLLRGEVLFEIGIQRRGDRPDTRSILGGGKVALTLPSWMYECHLPVPLYIYRTRTLSAGQSVAPDVLPVAPCALARHRAVVFGGTYPGASRPDRDGAGARGGYA